jgi:hypothetical protein
MPRFQNRRFTIGVFLLAEIIATGMGMGVPIFTILLGFVVGWFLPRVQSLQSLNLSRAMRKVLHAALLTSGFTVFLMAIIWLPTMSILFEPGRDVANFGIPMILYEPLVSFIGWIVLMVLISPFIQVLTTVFGAIVYMAYVGRKDLENAELTEHA